MTSTGISASVLKHRQLLFPSSATPVGDYNTQVVSALIDIVRQAVNVDSKVSKRKGKVQRTSSTCLSVVGPEIAAVSLLQLTLSTFTEISRWNRCD